MYLRVVSAYIIRIFRTQNTTYRKLSHEYTARSSTQSIGSHSSRSLFQTAYVRFSRVDIQFAMALRIILIIMRRNRYPTIRNTPGGESFYFLSNKRFCSIANAVGTIPRYTVARTQVGHDRPSDLQSPSECQR